MPNFRTRSYQKELMDDLTLHSDALRQNLEELSVINFWLGGNLVLKLALNRLKKQGLFKENRVYTIADIGSGGGDNLLTLVKWFNQNGIKTKITGIDANAFMVDYAKKRCENHPNIDFQQQNIFDSEISELQFDITTCSLFCHHFTDDELSTIFQQIKKITRHYFIINDLHRHPIAYYSIWLLVHLFNGSYLVKNDGPLSVLRAFRKKEIRAILNPVWENNRITWVWAFRWMCIMKK